jgi:uncharacterized protein (DUF2141 family)
LSFLSLTIGSPTVQASSDAMSITVTPTEVSEVIGNKVILTATVRYVEDFDPVGGQKVLCTIVGVHTLTGPPVSVVTNSAGQVQFSYTGIHVGSDAVTVFLDSDNNGKYDPGEPSATAQVTWTSPTLTLTPSQVGNQTGNIVRINARLDGGPARVTIRYTISGVAIVDREGVTDAKNGFAAIEYTSNTPGTDTIVVYADLNNNGKPDPNEPVATANVYWFKDLDILLKPATENPTVGAPETVTVTALDGIVVVPGITVVFRHGSNPNTPPDYAKTDANGQATFTYTESTAGTDTVSAWVDVDDDGEIDMDDPGSIILINWKNPPPVATEPQLPSDEALKAANPATPQPGCEYFPETQHNLCGDISTYWSKFGAAILGFPVTEPFQENGRTVQYTERERIEDHLPSEFHVMSYDGVSGPADLAGDTAGYADSPTILLGLLGDEVTAGRSGEGPFVSTTANPSGDCTFYAETGHNLCGGFRAYWLKYGGLAVYGFPISEEFQEVNPDTGKTYTVQYFERARYEWHPGEWPERFDVELGRLGAQVFSMKYGTKYA